MKGFRNAVVIAAAGIAALAATPASAFAVWVYYGQYGEVIGYRVVNDDGSVCYADGYQSTAYTYQTGPGDLC